MILLLLLWLKVTFFFPLFPGLLIWQSSHSCGQVIIEALLSAHSTGASERALMPGVLSISPLVWPHLCTNSRFV